MTWFEPQFGTISSEYPTGMKEVSLIGSMQEQEFFNPDISKPTEVIIRQAGEKIAKNITAEETAKAEEILKDSVDKIQSKIDSGEVSLDQGQKALNRIQETANKKLNVDIEKRYNKELKDKLSSTEFSTKIKSSEKFRGTYESAFTPSGNLGKIELAADITAGAISGIAPPVGIAYFAGKGFYDIAKGRKEDVRMIDVSPSGELITPRYMGEIPSAQTKKGGFSLLFAGASGLGYVSKIGAEITALRKAEIIAKPWTVTSKELSKVGDTTWLKISGSKVVPGASAEGSALLPVKVGKTGAFKILGGQGKVDIRVVDFMSQGVVKSGDDIIKSSIKYPTFGRGVVSKATLEGSGFNIPFENTKIYGVTGEGYVSPFDWQNVKVVGKKSKVWSKFLGRPFGDTYVTGSYADRGYKAFKFAGMSQKEGAKTIFTSGELIKARLYPGQVKVTGLFKPQVYGETLVQGGDDVVSKAYSSFSGKGGAKSSKTFLSNMFKPVTVTEQLPAQVIGEQFGGQGFMTGQSFAEQGLKITTSVVPAKLSFVGASVSPLLNTKQNIIPEIDYSFKPNVKINSKSIMKPMVEVKKTSKPKRDIDIFSKISSDFSSNTKQEVSSKVAQQSKSRLIQKQIQQQTTVNVFPSSSLFGVTGTGGLDLGFKIPIPGWGGRKPPIAAVTKKEQGYIPVAKSQGGKWIKLSSKPMSRSAALSRASKATDQTLSAQFKIVKAKGEIVSGNDNYFNQTQNKYRPYKIRKGQKVGLVNQFVEKRGSRIDSSGEKRGLKLAQYVKSQGWLSSTKKKGVKKKKSQWLI